MNLPVLSIGIITLVSSCLTSTLVHNLTIEMNRQFSLFQVLVYIDRYNHFGAWSLAAFNQRCASLSVATRLPAERTPLNPFNSSGCLHGT